MLNQVFNKKGNTNAAAARMQEIARATGFSVVDSVSALHDKHGLVSDRGNVRRWVGGGSADGARESERTSW